MRKHEIAEIEYRGATVRYTCTCGAKARSWVGTKDEAVALFELHKASPDNGALAFHDSDVGR